MEIYIGASVAFQSVGCVGVMGYDTIRYDTIPVPNVYRQYPACLPLLFRGTVYTMVRLD